MINLLPYELKKQTQAARMNTIIIRCIILLGVAVGFLFLACATTYIFIPKLNSTNTNSAKDSWIKSISNITIQNQVKVINSNLSIANRIINQQVSYSSILEKIALVLPKNTILESIAINNSTIGTPINLKILSNSSNLETTIKNNFNSSNVFSGYILQSTTNNTNKSSKYQKVFNISIVVKRASAL